LSIVLTDGGNVSVIFFDTETTGLDCKNCRIIELAMLTVDNGKIVEEYDEFIDIGEKLDCKITELTGITDEMLFNQGFDEEVIAEDLKERLAPGTVMVAHNCQFDLSFVYNLLKRHYPDEADGIVEGLTWYDTLTILKDRKDYPHKLIDAVNHYGIEEVNFHRAIEDTKALYLVTLAMKKERNDLKEYKDLFGYNPKWGIREAEKFRFIEYKAQPYHNMGLLPEDKILPNM
jgi:DNA polymerase III alpha subunit (gram-positive type)